MSQAVPDTMNSVGHVQNATEQQVREAAEGSDQFNIEDPDFLDHFKALHKARLLSIVFKPSNDMKVNSVLFPSCHKFVHMCMDHWSCYNESKICH
jgi:hypothetical protein